MICRLCLKPLHEDEAIFLFQSIENNAETRFAKLIAKYFHIEITADDTISTCICQDCCDHLDDFHNFWLYVDKKQSTLRNEFLEIKCDMLLEQQSDAAMHAGDHEEGEMLLDLKNVLVQEDNAERDQTHSTEFEYDENVVLPHSADEELHDSSDDDTPLMALKARSIDNVTLTKIKNENSNDSAADSKSKDKAIYKHKALKRKSRKKVDSIRKVRPVVKQNEEIITNFMQLNCDLCQHTVATYGDLRTHYREVHKTAGYVKCCNKAYYRASLLVEHINWHRNPDIYKCDICKKQLRNSMCLLMHKNMIHGGKASKAPPSVCEICKKQFRNKKNYENHLAMHDNQKSYNCEICGKSFATQQRVRRHIQSIHDNVYPHICDMCGKKFKFKPSFERHIQLHQGLVEEPMQCDICGEWLKNKHTLRLHRFKHDNTDVKCKICSRECPSNKALKRHVNYMHKLKKDLQCTFCDKTFKVAKSLEEHIATHTGAQLYSCPHCSRESRSQSNMYVHIKRYHVEEWIKAKIARSNDPSFKTKVE